MNKNALSLKRQMRIRKKIRSVTDKARLTVFRSNKYMYAQIIDDSADKTLLGISEKKLEKASGKKIDRARELGAKLAQMAKDKKITQVVFDKGRYAYHGRVKAFAEGAREGGLDF